MDNKFLRDFINMRSKLHQTVQTKNKEVAPSTATTIATIIEKKPPAKEVLEYFKNKNNLV